MVNNPWENFVRRAISMISMRFSALCDRRVFDVGKKMTFNDIELIVFDLDGTLVDSRQDIVEAFNHGLRAVGADDEAIRRIQPNIPHLIGTPLKYMYERSLADATGDVVDAACDAYRAYYIEHCADHTTLFSQVRSSLDRLAVYSLAVATTKKTYMAVRVVEQMGIADRFSLIQGTDDVPPKPNPAVLLLVSRTLRKSPERTWMVGDTVHDIAAAKRAGMKSCAVTYGFSSRRELEAENPTMLVDNLSAFASALV